VTICWAVHRNRKRQPSNITNIEYYDDASKQQVSYISKQPIVKCTPEMGDIAKVVEVYVQQGPLPRFLLNAERDTGWVDQDGRKIIHTHSILWVEIAPGEKSGDIDLSNKILVVAQLADGQYGMGELNNGCPIFTFENAQQLCDFVKSDRVINSSIPKDKWHPIVE